MLAPELLPLWGGVGAYIVELTRHLPRNVDVEVVTPYRTRLGNIAATTADYDLEDFFPGNVHINFISSAADTFVYNGAFQVACLRHVPKLVKRENIDVIHTHTAQMPDLLLQLRRLNVPTVATVHTTIAGQKRAAQNSGIRFRYLDFSEQATILGYPFLRISERFFFSGDRQYITISKWMKKRIGLYFPRLDLSRVQIIPNSVDTNLFRPHGGGDRENVLFTGRFISAKGLNYLADAIPEVVSKHPNATFTFIGPGNFQPYMNRIQAHNVPTRNIHFVGYVKERQEMLDYYHRCGIFIVPTLYENLPTRILEAMACGKPVVASDVCAIPEAITSEKNGILVPPKSVDALVEAINRLLDDWELGERLGANARKSVLGKFDWDVNARKVAKVYAELVEGA